MLSSLVKQIVAYETKVQHDMTKTRQKSVQSFAFVISIIAALCFCCGFVMNLAGPGQRDRINLDEKINPNDAPAASLVRLPGIGISRAEAIVSYRKKVDTDKAFRNCDDLQKVKGIGPKTAESVSQWLTFK